MREIQAERITEVVKRLCISANNHLPEDVKLLSLLEPDNEDYKKWALWIDEKYKIFFNIIYNDVTNLC